jgi:hypothetical protein
VRQGLPRDRAVKLEPLELLVTSIIRQHPPLFRISNMRVILCDGNLSSRWIAVVEGEEKEIK